MNALHVQEIAKMISDALEEKIDRTNPDEIAGKIDELRQLTANAATLKANAKKLLRQKELEILNKYKDSKLQASVLMRTISAECFEEEGWYVYADRLNAGLSHALDSMRTLLSYMKEEMRNNLSQ